MGKRVLYVVYDDGAGIDPRKDYDNIGVLTLSEHNRYRWNSVYAEAGCKYDGDSIEFACYHAPSAFFGSIDHQGGLVIPVIYQDHGSNGSRTRLETRRAVFVSPEQYSALEEAWEQHRRDYGGYPRDTTSNGRYSTHETEIIFRHVLGQDDFDKLFGKTDGYYVIPGEKINEWESEPRYGASVEGQRAAIAAAESEIRTLDLWNNGNVYGGIVVDLETGETDSCYGFITSDPEVDVVDSGNFEFDEVFGGANNPTILTYSQYKAQSDSDQLAYLRGKRTGNPRNIRRPRR